MLIRNRSGILIFFACLLTAFGAACSNQPANKGTANTEPLVKTEPAKPPGDAGDTVATGGDLAFMNQAAAGNMAEVELGKLAVKQAASGEVKQFGQKMIDDHSKALDELKKLAEQKKVMLPPGVLPTQKELSDKLSKLNGAEFDKEYVKAMLEAHQKDVTAFEAVSKTATDADVKAFATKTLPTLKTHLEMIKSLADKMDAKAK